MTSRSIVLWYCMLHEGSNNGNRDISAGERIPVYGMEPCGSPLFRRAAFRRIEFRCFASCCCVVSCCVLVDVSLVEIFFGVMVSQWNFKLGTHANGHVGVVVKTRSGTSRDSVTHPGLFDSCKHLLGDCDRWQAQLVKIKPG